jgi:hypothetical protein
MIYEEEVFRPFIAAQRYTDLGLPIPPRIAERMVSVSRYMDMDITEDGLIECGHALISGGGIKSLA